MPDNHIVDRLSSTTRNRFEARARLVVLWGGGFAVLMGLGQALTQPGRGLAMQLASGLGISCTLACIVLALRGRAQTALGGLLAAGLIAQLPAAFSAYDRVGGALRPLERPGMTLGMMAVASMVLPSRGLAPLVGLATAVTAVQSYVAVDARGRPLDEALSKVVMGAFLFGLLYAIRRYQEAEDAAREEVLKEHVDELEAAVRATRALASGQLGEANPEAVGYLAEVEALRQAISSAVGDIRSVAQELAAACSQLSATASNQASGAAEQAAAVAQTRAMVSEVSAAAGRIRGLAEEVDGRTRATGEQAQRLHAGLTGLIRNSGRVGTLLEEVRGIADKSDLLALNASLEGVRAGEAGRGFTLVAHQMQDLAKRVRASVLELQDLNDQVGRASGESQAAMDATFGEASTASRSAGDIRQEAEQQSESMRQVQLSVEQIGQVTHTVAAGAAQLERSARQLVGLAERMQEAVDAFS